MTEQELLGTELFNLAGKVAVVTGAGRGLGRSMALALAAAGADIVASSRTPGEIEELRDEVRGLGRRSEAITADTTVETDAERLIAETVQRLGRIDILVNNAGINIRKPVLELELAEYQQVLATNLEGYFLCARAAGKRMVTQGSGKVVNISSIMGRVAL